MIHEARPIPTTLKELRSYARRYLYAKGSPSPEIDVDVILGHVLGKSRLELLQASSEPVVCELLAKFTSLLQRRGYGEPVAYLVEEQEFYGRLFKVDSRVLIPRPESEHLIDGALPLLESGCRALDLGTGSGCLAVTLKLERPQVEVWGMDVSDGALQLAQENAERLGADVNWFRGDFFDDRLDAPQEVSLILSNPPYIAEHEKKELGVGVAEYEPHQALFAGTSGLEAYQVLARLGQRLLKPEGWLMLEIGHSQAGAVNQILEEAGWSSIRVTRDYAGKDRIIKAQSQS